MDWLTYITTGSFILQVIAAVFTFSAIIIFLSWSDRRHMTSKRLKAINAARNDLFEKQKLELSKKGQRADATLYSRFVQKFKLSAFTENEGVLLMCARAGLRGKVYPMIYTFFLFVCPVIFFFFAMLYFFSIGKTSHSPMVKFLLSLLIGTGGTYLPKIMLVNMAQKRQKELSAFFADTLDLLIICVEAGMSIEASFNKVAEEIGKQSEVLSEEIKLTTAEISFLTERRMAYENLAKRTNIPAFKALSTSLIQSEKYGTPLGQSLRVLSQEQREQLSQMIEKKAAALPAKLTVPMIVFFLPVLFVVILGPAIIQVMSITK